MKEKKKKECAKICWKIGGGKGWWRGGVGLEAASANHGAFSPPALHSAHNYITSQNIIEKIFFRKKSFLYYSSDKYEYIL